MGYCNSCNSYNCNCGCGGNKVIAYQSCGSSCNSSSSGTNFCKEVTQYITSNFVIPAANVTVEVTVSDSSKLYVGQGIQIGTYFFQIASIEDATTIHLIHNGSATPGVTVTAVHPTYGCYQFPIYPVGVVNQLIASTVIGVDAAFAEVASSIVSPTKQMVYGYSGPKKIELAFEMSATIANTPRYVQVNLPVDVAVGGAPNATFACLIDNGSGLFPATAYRRNNTIIVGLPAASNLANGALRLFRVSGSYDLQ